MATATRGRKKQQSAMPLDTEAHPEFTDSTIDIAAIDVPQGANPRTLFDDADLEELAASIRTHGILTPLLVKAAKAGRFDLLAGERRLRAAKRAGLQVVPVRMGAASLAPEVCDEIRLIENLLRKDLSAIDEANGFRAMLDRHGYTQETLAERIGKSQPHIANRMRLLKLPESWRKRIISGEIPHTHCRALLQFAEHPQILDTIERNFFGEKPREIGSVDWFTETVAEIAHDNTRPIAGEHFSQRMGRLVEFFTPTPDQREVLGIVEIRGVEHATNVELWNDCQRDYEQKLIDAQGEPEPEAEEREEGQREMFDGEGNARPEKPKLTPAQETAATAKAEQEARGKGDTVLAERVIAWRIDWLRLLLSRYVLDNGDFALRVVLLLLQRSGTTNTGRVVEMLEDEPSSQGADGFQAMIARFPRPVEILVTIAQESLWDGNEGRPSYILSGLEVEALAEAAEIDLEAEWQKNLAGDLTEGFWNLHSRDQLHDLACCLWDQSELPSFPKTKKDAVAHMLERSIDPPNRNLTFSQLPPIILPVALLKAPKAKPAKTPKLKPATGKKPKPAPAKAKKPAPLTKAAPKKSAKPKATKKK